MNFNLFLVFVLAISFPISILSESYSSYRLDDFLYLDNGIRKFVYGTRFDLIHSPAAKDYESSQRVTNSSEFSWGWNMYSSGNYLTQKGGRKSNETSFYENLATISPEIYSELSFINLKFFYVGGVNSFLGENRKAKIEKDTGIDVESLIGLKSNTTYIQAGRGFYRVDKCGFLLNSSMNFIEGAYFLHTDGFYIEFRGIFGNTNPEKQDISSGLSNHERRNIQGGLIRGSFIQWKLDWNAFGILQRRLKQFPSYTEDFYPGEEYKYLGVELGYGITKYLNLDLGGIGWIGTEDRYIPLIFQESSVRSREGILYYINLEYRLNTKNKLGLSGILERKHRFPDINSKNRFMGGDSSILLNLREHPVFLPLDFTKNTSIEGGGIFWVYRLFSIHEYLAYLKWNVNTTSSYYGLGWEGIASLGLKNDLLGFVFLSFAHARILPNVSSGLVVEEIQVPLKEERYERIFISGGIVF